MILFLRGFKKEAEAKRPLFSLKQIAEAVPDFKGRSRQSVQAKPEEIMWHKVRNRQFIGLKFRRQFGIREYIADFYCPEQKFVVEIDGDTHFTEEGIGYDRIRTEYIKSLGIKIIRFTNSDIMKNIEGVLESLMQMILELPSP